MKITICIDQPIKEFLLISVPRTDKKKNCSSFCSLYSKLSRRKIAWKRNRLQHFLKQLLFRSCTGCQATFSTLSIQTFVPCSVVIYKFYCLPFQESYQKHKQTFFFSFIIQNHFNFYLYHNTFTTTTYTLR